jgi:pilus assembly protein FimV
VGRSIASAILATALVFTALQGAHAAGLGKLTVFSPLGQPLNAEIEIVSLQSGEEDGLNARLASPEAFRQAGVDYNSALSSVRFAVQRKDGRTVLRLSTTQPVNEPFLDMLVELQWSTGRLVREYTFLLDPPEYKGPALAAAPNAAPAPRQPAAEPQPATPPVQEKPLEPAPSAAAPSAPAAPATPAAPGTTYEVKKGDTLARIAREHMAPGVSLNQMLTAIYRANEDAFIRNNVNLVRAGRILTIPAEDTTTSVDPEEANQLISSHMTEFAQYRARLAAAPTSAEATPGQRSVTGRIEPKPAQPKPAAPDQLRLSKAEPGKAGSAGSRAATDDDRAAQERAAKEAESRVTDLEKNVADLQKLLALKNQQLAELEQKAGTKPPAEAPKPAAPAPKPAAEAPKPAAEAPKAAAPEAPKPAAEAPKPAAEAPKPAAEAPKPAAPGAKPPAKPAAKAAAKKGPPPESSLVDEFLDNPLYLGILGLVILLLVVYGWWTWRRKKATQAKFQSSVLGASSAAGAGSPSALGAPAAASVSGAAPAPSASQAPSQPAPIEAEEVDPIAEADVYMAYGRDAQAEEILKEALQKDSSRVPVHAKLLEIYANRRDAKSFEQTALKLKGLTNGSGPEWEKAAALGRSIDPQNGVYAAAAGAAAAAAPAPAAAPAAAPTLDFDLGGAAAQAAAPDITLDGTPKEGGASIDFDLGGATTPPPAPAPAAPAAPAADEKSDFTPDGTIIMSPLPADSTAGGGAGLDFDLGLGDTKAPAAAAPAAKPAAAPAPAPADSGGGLDFDLNLDLGTGGGEKTPEPAAAAPMDLSAISLDLGAPGEPAAAGGGGDPKWQEVATKLDLAKAYEEMGDKDGARELLNEVMKDGDAAQKGQAQQLLAKLA